MEIDEESTSVVKCGWKSCGLPIEPFTESGDRRLYCSGRHKKKAEFDRSRQRNREVNSSLDAVRAHILKSSGFFFGRMLGEAEMLAEQHGHDQELLEGLMVDAIAGRIAQYRAYHG